MFAMKYMNKAACIRKEAVRNVLKEIEILQNLEHPFLVNLWFTFQDEEDMFMVVDLLLGGDLRYHIQQEVKFTADQIILYVAEIGLALDYLQSKFILHRDIKPDNILLDEEGHVHITDFNIATELKPDDLATSMSGTKPYMAPEVFDCALDECPGYSYPADWWSTGVVAYEMLRGKRPFDIHSNTSIHETQQLFVSTHVHYPSSWPTHMCDMIKKLLEIKPTNRLCSVEDLKQQPAMKSLVFDDVLGCKIKPSFIPAKDHLNCDPTFELEEMIIEAKPLHKKKKRLAKKKAEDKPETDMDPMQVILEKLTNEFKVYNRDKDKVEDKLDVPSPQQSARNLASLDTTNTVVVPVNPNTVDVKVDTPLTLATNNDNNPSANTDNPSANPANPSANTDNPSANTDNPPANTNNTLEKTSNPSENTNGPLANPNDQSANINGPLANPNDQSANINGPLANPNDPSANTTTRSESTTKASSNLVESDVQSNGKAGSPVSKLIRQMSSNKIGAATELAENGPTADEGKV